MEGCLSEILLTDSLPIVASGSVNGKVVPFFEPFIATRRGFIGDQAAIYYIHLRTEIAGNISLVIPLLSLLILKSQLSHLKITGTRPARMDLNACPATACRIMGKYVRLRHDSRTMKMRSRVGALEQAGNKRVELQEAPLLLAQTYEGDSKIKIPTPTRWQPAAPIPAEVPAS